MTTPPMRRTRFGKKTSAVSIAMMPRWTANASAATRTMSPYCALKYENFASSIAEPNSVTPAWKMKKRVSCTADASPTESPARESRTICAGAAAMLPGVR